MAVAGSTSASRRGRSLPGDQVLVSGKLTCDRHANAAGQVVKLYEHTVGSAGYIPVQSTTTETNGGYEISPTGVETRTARSTSARMARRADTSGSGSLAQVTLSGPPEGTQLLTGAPNQVTFTGTVNPADVGARVILQRQNAITGNEWHRIGVGQVGAGGSYSITHTFRVPGDASIRVLVRSDKVNIPSESNVARVRDLPDAEPEPDDQCFRRSDHASGSR